MDKPTILFEDNHVIVAVKKPNQLTQSDATGDESLLDQIKSYVKGFMVESYIEEGSQKIGEGVYGKSITDPCLGWEKTEKLILELAHQL